MNIVSFFYIYIELFIWLKNIVMIKIIMNRFVLFKMNLNLKNKNK